MHRYKKFTIKNKLFATLFILVGLSGCVQKYSSSWKCDNPEGIGCSSIFYADQIARKHIILNENNLSERKKRSKKKKSSNLVIGEHYSDFEKVKTREVEID